jgi:rod shape-determining protein MreD
VTASIGFMRNEKSGLLVGFFCGLFIDVFFGDIIGFYALIYMYIGYLNGNIKLPLALISLSDLCYGLLCYLFLYLLQGKLNFIYYALHIIIPEVVYTIVISIVLYPIILQIYKHLDKKDRSETELV